MICVCKILRVTFSIEILKCFDQIRIREKLGVHHLLLATKNSTIIIICEFIIKSSWTEKLLGTKSDFLKSDKIDFFKNHVNRVSKKR